MGKTVLIIIGSDGTMDSRPLDVNEKSYFTLGRDHRQNDIVISESVVSKNHGYLVRQHGTFFYKDLHSSNGTYVDVPGKRTLLHQSDQFVELAEGSVIRIGSTDNTDKLVLMYITDLLEDETLDQYFVSGNEVTIGRTSKTRLF